MIRKVLGAALFAALLVAPSALASPCTSNNWQPTFVHDLDTDDTPFYVTAGGSFVPLQWTQNGGYVPHACQLVRGPQDVRDTRGFTTCQDYTRVQCGCSRSIPGNSTCAAFLAWHSRTAQSAAPGGAGSSSARPGFGAAPAAPGATPLPSPVAPGFPAPSAAQQSPAPTAPVAVTGWNHAAQYVAQVQVDPAVGLVLRGGPWTNGQLQNGSFDGNRVLSAQAYDFSRGGDAYMRVLANGGGQYMGFWPRVIEGVSVLHMTTHHSWAGSVVIPEDTWVYLHVRVDPGGAYHVGVATGAYDDRGGQVIYRNVGRLANPVARLDLQFADNYAGQTAYMVIGEAFVRMSGGAAPYSPTPRAAAPAPAAGRPGGGSCSVNSDCESSICLLGVCAPPSR